MKITEDLTTKTEKPQKPTDWRTRANSQLQAAFEPPAKSAKPGKSKKPAGWRENLASVGLVGKSPEAVEAEIKAQMEQDAKAPKAAKPAKPAKEPKAKKAKKAKAPKTENDEADAEAADRLPTTLAELKETKGGFVAHLFLTGKDKDAIAKELKTAFKLSEAQAMKITRRIVGRVRLYSRVFELVSANK